MQRLPTDDDTNALFEQAARWLGDRLEYSPEEAERVVREYYLSFRSEEYCCRRCWRATGTKSSPTARSWTRV